MRTLIERSQEAPAYKVVAVLADRAAAGLATAHELGVPARLIEAERTGFEQALASAIDAYRPTLVALAGFMRILSAGFVEHFADRMLNIHPSLLPKYPGLDTHRRALEAGESEHGATVHFVTAALDAGPAVLQARVPVRPGDDVARLSARVLEQEHRIYPLAVRWFCAGRLACRHGRAWFDGRPLSAPLDYDELVARGEL